jgi:hypothetical protein
MFTEDLGAFFNAAEHAIAATYNGAQTLNVIFDRQYLEPLTGVAGSNPVALVQTSALPDANPSGKTLQIGATTYTIRGVESVDDGAISLLQLTT